MADLSKGESATHELSLWGLRRGARPKLGYDTEKYVKELCKTLNPIIAGGLVHFCCFVFLLFFSSIFKEEALQC